LTLGIAQLLLLFAAFAYLMLAMAEQGGIGSELSPTPARPLPFERELTYGVDLTDRTSFDALQWLTAAGLENLALVALPVDAEIVASLTVEERAEEARGAIEALISAAGTIPAAVCFHKPVSPLSEAELADAVVSLMRDSYTQRVAYVNACDPDADPEWQAALADELAEPNLTGSRLVPLSVGEAVRVTDIDSINELRSSNLRAFSGSEYVVPRVIARQPLDAFAHQRAQAALRDAAQLALVLLNPAPNLDPNTFARSLVTEPLATNPLPEGFTSATSVVVLGDQTWTTTMLGTTHYVRAAASGVQLKVTFVGTELVAYVLRSPTAGSVAVWIDRAPGAQGEAPDLVIDLAAAQARDAAVVLATDLPADQHNATLVVQTDEVVLSGLFLSGKPEAAWSTAVASVGLIVIAVASGAVVARSAVRTIRRRTLPPDEEARNVLV
jgi:hypothetical protein